MTLNNYISFKRLKFKPNTNKIVSLLRIKLKKQYLDSETSKIWILYNLMKIFGNPDYRIKGWGKNVLGYGLRQKDFDNNEVIEKISSRQFKSYKAEMIKRKLIMRLDTKKDDYYTITPLGIVDYMRNVKLTNLNEVKQVTIILFYFINTWHKKYVKNKIEGAYTERLFNKLVNGFKEKKNGQAFLIDMMNYSINHVEILEEDNNPVIYFSHVLLGRTDIRMAYFSIVDSEILMRWERTTNLEYQKLDDLNFFHRLGDHIFSTFFYHIFINSNVKNIPKDCREFIYGYSVNRYEKIIGMLYEDMRVYHKRIKQITDSYFEK